MIRNRYILCLALLLFACTSSAQSRYALSFSDYMDGKFTTVENLTIESRSKSKRFWSGGADFKPKTNDKQTDKLLKKEVKYIIHQDTLYVNCRQLRYEGCKFGNWYAPGFRFGTDRICFIGIKIGKEQTNEQVAAGIFFGAIGGAIVASKQLKNRVCYLVESDNKKVKLITKDNMRTILLNYPEYLQEYNALPEKEKESADVIMEYLIKTNLLMRY
ncbi:DUF6563 family protein [Bacteroides sp. UBA939]|uniref:DUF6563 family protein n=1 Tax=Bacteroides sp. UBA939 TaxID=1946092 RepID=UPI0025BEFE07|nr:DUF6563 family protein [Bacteroides sp. UBA939]